VANAGGLGFITALTQPAPEDRVKEIARFLATKQSPIHENIKRQMVENDERATDLIFRTMRDTSRVAGTRGEQVYETGDPDHGIRSAGQIQGLIHDIPSRAELISRIVAEAETLIQGRLKSMVKRLAAVAG
jgi:nitronate monooxygenase